MKSLGQTGMGLIVAIPMFAGSSKTFVFSIPVLRVLYARYFSSVLCPSRREAGYTRRRKAHIALSYTFFDLLEKPAGSLGRS